MKLFATCMSKNFYPNYITLHIDFFFFKDNPIEKWPKEIQFGKEERLMSSDHSSIFLKGKWKLKQWDTVSCRNLSGDEGDGNLHISGGSINWCSPFG